MYENGKLDNTALLIDIENLIRTATEIGLPVDLGKIVDKLLEFGRLTIRRSYGDLDFVVWGDWELKRKVRASLVENLIQIEDIPYVARKNSADIKLTVDALATAYSCPEISQFAIVSSDRDYVPLILKLRELGKVVIGIGTSPDTVNPLYVKACDAFLYYSSFFASPDHAAQGVDLVQDQGATLDSYVQLLRSTVQSLGRQGKRTTGGIVVPLMRQLRPDYDLTLVGLKNFHELVQIAEAKGLVHARASGGDVLVTLPEDGQVPDKPATAPASQDFVATDLASAIEGYSRFFREKLKCEIPKAVVRERIYDVTIDILKGIPGAGGSIELNDLSLAIVDRLGPDETSKTSTFKILYGLFRGGVFSSNPSEREPFNPRITGVSADRPEWDFRFVKNCLQVLGRERAGWPIVEDALGAALHVDRGVIDDVLKSFA